MPFNGDVVVKETGVQTWALTEPLSYTGRDETFTVPAGFGTDLASVPRPLVWLIPRYGKYTKSAIVHDYLCRTAVVSRLDADGIFRRSMNELGVSFLRRWLMWAAVRFAAKLSGASLGQVLIWLLITLPGAVFVAVPALAIIIWLVFFWLIEGVVYLLLHAFTHKRPNKPSLLVKLS